MTQSALIKSMLDNSVHIGHKREFWSPKMRDYIFGVQNGIHVFDLYKTIDKLNEAKALLEDYSSRGKTILFVGTKIQTKEIIALLAEGTGQHYINSKWVPGLLTNFTTIKKRIAVYNELESDFTNGMLDNLTKKEKAIKLKELEKLRSSFVGVKTLRKIPDLVVVVDGKYEDLALTESAILHIPTLALLGSTGDIDKATHFIPCNVNSIKALAYILGELKMSIKPKKAEEKKPIMTKTKPIPKKAQA